MTKYFELATYARNNGIPVKKAAKALKAGPKSIAEAKERLSEDHAGYVHEFESALYNLNSLYPKSRAQPTIKRNRYSKTEYDFKLRGFDVTLIAEIKDTTLTALHFQSPAATSAINVLPSYNRYAGLFRSQGTVLAMLLSHIDGYHRASLYCGVDRTSFTALTAKEFEERLDKHAEPNYEMLTPEDLDKVLVRVYENSGTRGAAEASIENVLINKLTKDAFVLYYDYLWGVMLPHEDQDGLNLSYRERH
jgi:hypothetical protein